MIYGYIKKKELQKFINKINIMAWLVVERDKSEWIFKKKPFRNGNDDYSYWGNIDSCYNRNYMELPKGSIKKLIGKELTWNDEPVEI